MTLFKRTEAAFEELSTAMSSLETDAGADVVHKKRLLDQITELETTLAQNCSKLRKAAEESDPAKVGWRAASGARALCLSVPVRVHGGARGVAVAQPGRDAIETMVAGARWSRSFAGRGNRWQCAHSSSSLHALHQSACRTCLCCAFVPLELSCRNRKHGT